MDTAKKIALWIGNAAAVTFVGGLVVGGIAAGVYKLTGKKIPGTGA